MINHKQHIFPYLLALIFVLSIGLFNNLTVLASVDVKDQSDADGEVLHYEGAKNCWWYNEQAKYKYKKKDFEGAIADYTSAISLSPDIPEFYYNRGKAFAIGNHKREALGDYKRTLELDPDYLVALNNLGWNYLRQREFHSAFLHFVNYLKLAPKDPKIIFNWGQNSKYAFLLNEMGWDYLRQEKLPQSIRYFTNYIELEPDDPNTYLGLALVYYKYSDFENAKIYLNKAKHSEPILYQGFSGIFALENEGAYFSADDKRMLKSMFIELSDKKQDFKQITTSSSGKFIMGFLYIFLGIMALILYLFRINKNEGYILYLALLNFCFSIKFLFNNPLIQITELPSPGFWIVLLPLVSFITPIALIFFSKYFIGWGWKRSIFWLLIYSILHGFVEVFSQYSEPAKGFYSTSNTIFGILAAIVLFANLFHSMLRKNREVQIIGAGLGLFLLGVLYDNLAGRGWLPTHLSFDEPAYFVFNLCMIYVAFQRVAKTEKELVAVNQDLETARNIQNAILPEKEPCGDNYEVSSAYLPMALIGGDYYDYHMQEKDQIGVLIADVSGHGIGAALIASMIKVAFNSHTHNMFNPAEILGKMNMGLAGQLNDEFITAAYMGIDLNKKELIYSSAGHPPMIIYKRDINEINEIKVSGIPIGVYDETEFKQTRVPIDKGDRLVLYTDGVLDVFNPGGVAFGKHQFIDHIKETKNLLADDMVDSLLSNLNTWSEKKEGETHEDDITVIVFDVL